MPAFFFIRNHDLFISISHIEILKHEIVIRGIQNNKGLKEEQIILWCLSLFPLEIEFNELYFLF